MTQAAFRFRRMHDLARMTGMGWETDIARKLLLGQEGTRLRRISRNARVPKRLGENMQREWDVEPHSDELYDALQLRKIDREAGLTALRSLAVRGSVLAMMYLGHDLSSEKDASDNAEGEEWLKKSAEGGSVEGRFQLAFHYWRKGDGAAAVVELESLAAQGFAPASYQLGDIFYRGDLIKKDVSNATRYLKKAIVDGHLGARGLLSWIYRKEKMGVAARISSHWQCFAKIPSLSYYFLRYPNSDRLRGLSLPASLMVKE